MTKVARPPHSLRTYEVRVENGMVLMGPAKELAPAPEA